MKVFFFNLWTLCLNAKLSPLKIISYSLNMYFTLFSKWKVNLNNNMLIINFKRASVCYPVNVRVFFFNPKKTSGTYIFK